MNNYKQLRIHSWYESPQPFNTIGQRNMWPSFQNYIPRNDKSLSQCALPKKSPLHYLESQADLQELLWKGNRAFFCYPNTTYSGYLLYIFSKRVFQRNHYWTQQITYFSGDVNRLHSAHNLSEGRLENTVIDLMIFLWYSCHTAAAETWMEGNNTDLQSKFCVDTTSA